MTDLLTPFLTPFLVGWQPIAAGVVVALACVYLVWKLGFSDRKPRRKRGPDVPVAKLVRKTPKSGCH
ncbi:MAG: hypothetical protein H6721_18915 [Sandaracinus sp.]|nr:hypothetical protein [Sandaracinus sp.]